MQQHLGVPFAIEGCSGSGSCTTFRVHTYAKVGNHETVNHEARAYEELSRQLGDVARLIFPRTSVQQLSASTFALFVEPVAGLTLEDAILRIADLIGEYGRNDPRVREQEQVVERMILIALEHLERLRYATHRAQPGHRDALRDFTRELETAIRLNLSAAGLSAIVPAYHEQDRFWNVGKASLAHRDCSAVNIIGDAANVRFIDPRTAVPNCVNGTRFASPIFDLMALQVSLERKELEIRRRAPDFTLNGKMAVFQVIEMLLHQEGATASMRLLCELAVNSAYAACRCSYCLDPSRAWLYKRMVQATTQMLSALDSSA